MIYTFCAILCREVYRLEGSGPSRMIGVLTKSDPADSAAGFIDHVVSDGAALQTLCAEVWRSA